MSLRRVIRWSNGNFVGFPRIILKIDKNYPRKYNLHFSGERKIWPTRNWNLTINFVAIWGQWALKCLILVYSHSNIILEYIFWHQTYQYLVNWLICRFCHKPEKCNLCFITWFLTIFIIILEKPTKFPFDRHITHLCGIHTTQNIIEV